MLLIPNPFNWFNYIVKTVEIIRESAIVS
jgi:hypothetical protein